MNPIPNQLTPLIGTVPAWALLVATLVVSLVLLFAGRSVVKVIAFLVVGLIGASIGGTLAAQYLTSFGILGALLGLLVGFVLGGLIGVVIVAVGIGLVIGYAAYLLTREFVSGMTIPLIVGFVFVLVGMALYNRILGVVTAVAGGFLMFDILRVSGLDWILSVVIAAGLTLAGIWVQEGLGRKVTQPTASNSGGQPRPSDHR